MQENLVKKDDLNLNRPHSHRVVSLGPLRTQGGRPKALGIPPRAYVFNFHTQELARQGYLAI